METTTGDGAPASPNVSAGDQTYLFTSREWDDELRLYYFRARYYRHLEGTFAERDPVRPRYYESAYEYADHDPVDRNDPTGEQSRSGSRRSRPFNVDAAWNDCKAKLPTRCAAYCKEQGYSHYRIKPGCVQEIESMRQKALDRLKAERDKKVEDGMGQLLPPSVAWQNVEKAVGELEDNLSTMLGGDSESSRIPFTDMTNAAEIASHIRWITSRLRHIEALASRLGIGGSFSDGLNVMPAILALQIYDLSRKRLADATGKADRWLEEQHKAFDNKYYCDYIYPSCCECIKKTVIYPAGAPPRSIPVPEGQGYQPVDASASGKGSGGGQSGAAGGSPKCVR